MLKAFVEKLEQLVPVKILEVGGRSYSTAKIHEVLDPACKPFTVNTLTGIADYLKANFDALDLKRVAIHIESPHSVGVFSRLWGNFRQREYFLLGTPRLRKFDFGQYLGVENFIISLQSLFVQNQTIADLTKLVGNLTDGKTTQFCDDGITQQVTAKTGVARVDNVKVPSPVTLAPYRTFIEVAQPESKFVFRIKSHNEIPMCALFEADGGAWEIQAVKSIGDWFRTQNLGVTIFA